ncbi:type I restriction endonuclease subunit R [bacterium]|nr:type I restriction endonuclease subunit R [bacterium]
MAFNENTRVKLPAILHLVRLGYQYISLKDDRIKWNKNSNIATSIFFEAINRINPDLAEGDDKRLLQEVELTLDNEDLGKAFYQLLSSNTNNRIIDFSDFEKNSFHVVTELTYKNGEEEFRSDITLLINGMPLVFIEVKKPNNREGILAERDRIDRRFQNKKFRRFINITQMMIFSNNMEYDDLDIEPLQGAFYATSSYSKAKFNYFREEDNLDLSSILIEEDDDLENYVLKDNNLIVIKHSPEFITNKETDTPTNRILTSLCNKKRLQFILQYAIAYVNEEEGLEKHIMRYPQMFASKAIEKSLNKGVKKGIIWHTQGSGKTALAYYSVKYLTNYFKKSQIIPKFYFIVDRLDLLKQAKTEFLKRDLIVHIVNSRQEFVDDIKTTTALYNNSGKAEITVVNIQKFSEDSSVISDQGYDLNIQRIYFLDEVHRSYNPRGSFLANLYNSDKDAILIGLTGTPLITKEYKSKEIFGDYIHKYYYNASIADGYTLRLIREEISSDYSLRLKEILKELEINKGGMSKNDIFAKPSFVEPMLDYIIKDFEKSRLMFANSSIGAMVVCDSSKQAKMMFEKFQNKYTAKARFDDEIHEEQVTYTSKFKKECRVTTSQLILNNIGSKQDRDDWVRDYKAGDIDILFVFNMLLTGFDAPRLKKLYLGRVVKSHNLLQTLTRVNRTYKDFRYGYVVDFADIISEFDKTNEMYFKELNGELGDDFKYYDLMFKSQEEIEKEIAEIKAVLFIYDTENAEEFSKQISIIDNRQQILQIKKALENAKGLYNLIRSQDNADLLNKLDFKKLNDLYKETVNHLALLNAKDDLANNIDNTNLINIALEDVIFHFTKISEAELILADELKNNLRKTREAFELNQDKKDIEYVNLYEELKRLLEKNKLSEVSQSEMKGNIGLLNKIYDKIKELNRKNNLIKTKYNNDVKFMRIHKRLLELGDYSKNEVKIFNALIKVKESADSQVLMNYNMLNNIDFFDGAMSKIVVEKFNKEEKFAMKSKTAKYINNLIVNEYLKEFNPNIINGG